MNDDSGALPAETSLADEPGAALEPAQDRSAGVRAVAGLRAAGTDRRRRPAQEHPVRRLAGSRQPAGRGIRGAGRPAGVRRAGPWPPGDADVRWTGGRTAVPRAAQRRHVHPVPPRAPGLPAALQELRPDRRGLQRDALPGAAVVQAPGALPGEPHAHRAVVDPVPPAVLHGGPEHRAGRHAPGAPQQPVPHRVPLHRGIAAADRGRPGPDPADLQRRRGAGSAHRAVAGADVPRVRQARRLQAPRPAAAAVGPGAARDGREAGDRRGRAGAAAAAGPGRARRRVHRPGVGRREAPADVRGVAVPASGADRGLGHRGRRGGDPRHSLGGVRRTGAA